MTVGTALPIDDAWAQGVKRPSAGAGQTSRSITLRAVVHPFCKLSKVHHGTRLHGVTDDGAAIDSTIGSEGGFTVICNKPYAMNLERSPVWGAPAFLPKRRASAANPFGPGLELAPVFGAPDLLLERRRVAAADASDAFALARVTPEPETAERDFEVVLSVELNDGPLQSSCVMGSAQEMNFVCHAFPGADGARLPLPRMDARMVVTGSEARAPVFASAQSDIPPQTLLALPGGGRRALAEARGSDSLAALDSVVRQQRTGDRLTISVTAKY